MEDPVVVIVKFPDGGRGRVVLDSSAGAGAAGGGATVVVVVIEGGVGSARDAFEHSRSWESCFEYSFSCCRRLDSKRESAGRWTMSVRAQVVQKQNQRQDSTFA